MTTQRTAGSKAAARRDKAALDHWAKRQLAIAERATSRAVAEHLAAGRTVVFERDGRLYAKSGARAKAKPLQSASEMPVMRRDPGFAESSAPDYISRPKKKVRRSKSR